MAQYLNKTGLTTLWTKIKYTFALKSHTHKKSEITDLTIPTVNNPTITINQGGVKKGSFSLNQSGAATIDLTDNDTTYSTATQSSDGLMSASDKKKLEGIAEGANKITVDSSLSSTSTNPVQNKVIKSALDGKAGSSHSHSSLTNSSGRIFNVPTGGSGGEQKTLVITDDLNAYQPAGNYASSTHKHPISDINNLQSTIDGIYTDMGLQDEAIAGKADSVHTHEISNINGLQSALNGKSNLDHNHDSVYQAKGDYATNDALKNYVTGTTFIDYTTYIEGEVNKKANVSHSHEISNVNGLQSALDGKSGVGHTHTISNITNLQSTIESIYSDMGLQDEAIAGKADSIHTHKISNIDGLQSALDGKSNSGHTHSISNVSGLQSALDGKSASSHTHSDLVPKKHNSAFYPYIGSTNNQPNYKITLPISGYTSSNYAWMMITMELVLGGSYDSGANGKIFLCYYFLKNPSNVWSADHVRAIGIGNKLSDNGVSIQYDITNPGIFYVHANNSRYNSFSIQNLTANDSALSFDFSNTSIEAVDSIPSGLTKVPLTCVDSKGDNKLYVNNTSVSLDGHTHTSVADIYNNKTTTFAYSQDGLGYDSYTWLAGWNGYELRAVNKSQFATAGHTHSKSEVGLGNVDNTADANKNVNYATSAGDADTLDGNHASAFARVAADNNLMCHTDEFTFASNGFSGAIWLNYRTAGGTNGNITEYKLGNGAGKALGSIIHSGNIGSQNVNYANSAGSVAWENVSGRPTSLPASNISMSSDGTTLTITYS